MARCFAERACLTLPHLRRRQTGTQADARTSSLSTVSTSVANSSKVHGGIGQTLFGLIDARGGPCLESQAARPTATCRGRGPEADPVIAVALVQDILAALARVPRVL